jgi:hypothetical protein
MRTHIKHLFLLGLLLSPAAGIAYTPPSDELLGLVIDASDDPLAMPEEEADVQPSPEDDPLVLDEDTFAPDGSWVETGSGEDTATHSAAPEQVQQQSKSEASSAPAVPVSTGGKPVLYRGGKVFTPPQHPVAPIEPTPVQSTGSTTGTDEDAIETDTGSGSDIAAMTGSILGSGAVVLTDEETASGTITDEEALAPTGQEPEEAAEEKPRKERSFMGMGTVMSVALAIAAAAAGLLILKFKGKGPSTAGVVASSAPATVSAAPAPEESKLQQAIAEMKEPPKA